MSHLHAEFFQKNTDLNSLSVSQKGQHTPKQIVVSGRQKDK